MENQIAIYCSHKEWVGVATAVREGLEVLAEKARAGDERAQNMLAWANLGGTVFQERLIEELGLQSAYDAYLKGDFDKAKDLAEAKGKADLRAIEQGKL